MEIWSYNLNIFNNIILMIWFWYFFFIVVIYYVIDLFVFIWNCIDIFSCKERFGSIVKVYIYYIIFFF